jgi:hypothetical protein
MEIRSGSVDFSLPMRGNGPRTSSQTIVFPRPVTSAAAGLSGYTIEFSGGDLRDWSDGGDDQYDGRIYFTIIGE